MGKLKVTVGGFTIELEGKERDLLERFSGIIRKISSGEFEKILTIVGEKRPKVEKPKIIVPEPKREKPSEPKKVVLEKPPKPEIKPSEKQAKEPMRRRTFAKFDENGREVCRICGKTMSVGSKGMSFHVKTHDLSIEEYREKYPKREA